MLNSGRRDIGICLKTSSVKRGARRAYEAHVEKITAYSKATHRIKAFLPNMKRYFQNKIEIRRVMAGVKDAIDELADASSSTEDQPWGGLRVEATVKINLDKVCVCRTS